MKNSMIILLLICFLSCATHDNSQPLPVNKPITIPAVAILADDSLLQHNNGSWLYKGQPFSGTIIAWYPSHQLQSSQSFYNGKEEGWLVTFYPNGVRERKRYFHAGEKDSVSYGWWDNGNLRFEYHFAHGNYNGDFKEWYYSGKPLQYIVYNNGTDMSGKGWRENGKLYMNFINKNGRRYGLMNAQPCYSLRGERGEYVKSN